MTIFIISGICTIVIVLFFVIDWMIHHERCNHKKNK